MLVQKENVQLTINLDELKRYIADGFKEVKIEKKEKSVVEEPTTKKEKKL